jgi:D-sedoheptulose 7-phosphate isomerase
LAIHSIIEEHIKVAQALFSLEPIIAQASQLCKDTLLNGGKLLLAGNGGSAADAQHIAAELVGRFDKNRRAFPAIALTTDTSALTAISNDFGFDAIFSRQLEALARSGDVFIGITTSGNSPNMIKAFETARQMDVKTILLSGKNGGQLRGVADIDIIVPSDTTARIQEMHILIGHILCSYFEK